MVRLVPMGYLKKTFASLLGAGLVCLSSLDAAEAQTPSAEPKRADPASQVEPQAQAAHDIERDPKTGNITAEYYWLGEVHHRLGGPAVIEYDKNTGQVLSEEYWRSFETGIGKPHRDGDLPATIEYDYSSGKKIVVMETWWHNGFPDRDNAPEHIERDATTGKIVAEEYWHHGKCDRSDGPAKLEYHPVHGKDAPPLKEIYYHASKLDRAGGPALIRRDPETFRVVTEHYWRKNLLHREDGPAIIDRDPQTGQVTHEEFWINGRKVDAPPKPQPPPRPSP